MYLHSFVLMIVYVPSWVRVRVRVRVRVCCACARVHVLCVVRACVHVFRLVAGA